VYLFPNKTHMGAVSPATVQEACRHIAGRDESLRHLTPHVLRHTFATMALLNCHDIKRTQEILGHGKKSSVKIPVVMLRYLHPDVQENRGELQHSKLRGAVAAKRNPEQTVRGGGSLVPSEIYEKLKSGEFDTIPVPGKRNRVYVYSRRRDDVVEVSEDRAQTWLALRDASRSVSKQLSDATSNEVMRRRIQKTSLATAPEGGVVVPPPEKFSRLGLDVLPPSPPETPVKPKRASKAPAEPKVAGKAKKNPLETPMNDDWYWKAIYSNVPPGPSRAHPVAQRNGRASFSSNDGVTRRNPPIKLHFAKNGTPYVYENGRPKFISKAEAASIKAARRNPAGTHGALARNNPKKVYDLYVYEGEETRFAGTFGSAKAALKVAPKGNSEIRIRYEKEGSWDADTYAYVTKQGTLDLTGNVRRNPDIWQQVIDPFSVSEEAREGRQPIARRNKSKKKPAKAKAKKNNHRVWDQVIDPFSVTEARTYGRQPIGRRNPSDIWEQVIGPFSVSEEAREGRQPLARRNKSKKSKAKRNGVVRVYEVK